MRKKGILSGVRVLDLTRMLSGPYSTMVLADHGAEVIKVEDKNGDTSRFNGPYDSSDKEKKWAGYFISLNRNKKNTNPSNIILSEILRNLFSGKFFNKR